MTLSILRERAMEEQDARLEQAKAAKMGCPAIDSALPCCQCGKRHENPCPGARAADEREKP